MCGFIGCYYETPRIFSNSEKSLFEEMNNMIFHRGPDSDGYYMDEHIQFGFRRLSILDVEGAPQPLFYENERYVIIFNGEIYNYIELREMLKEQGATFATHGDTEVIVALYARMGEECVHHLRGMFSFLIWDREEKVLFGARDHFGIKPLFIHQRGEQLFFASEKKSILHALQEDHVNVEQLQQYLTYQYVPEPESMSENITKVEPGHYFVKKMGQPLVMNSYWKPTFTPTHQDKDALIKEIRDVLYDSVEVHMRSDVPVGSFLSGGIDSTIIASIASELKPDLKTFSIGFERDGFSEVDVAKETAAALNIENIDVKISAEEYMNELPKIMWHMDDPLADPACVPLYFVAKEARKHATVVLSGEGADELFGGYNIYQEPNSLKMFQHIPEPGRKLLKSISTMLPEGMKGKSFLERGCTPITERYYGNAKIFTEAEKKEILLPYNNKISYTDVTKPMYQSIEHLDDVSKMQYIDMYTWLRGDILVKADKMTMANSIELRVPFLDKEVFKVASRIHPDVKIANGTTKSILREAARGIIPDHVLDRKKLGFPVPIRHWLKDEMHDWAISIIQESNVDHLINKKYVLDLLEAHCSGKGDYSRKIWTVLVFMLWNDIFVDKKYDFTHDLEKNKIALS